MRLPLLATVAAFALLGCSAGSDDPMVGFGPNPPLKGPQKSLLPTVGVPDVVGWPAGAAPKAPAGFTVTRYAEGLDHPRWLLTLPNGDVLAAESASEPSKADKSNQGIKGFFQKMLMKKVGSVKPSPNKVVLLRDADGDGIAETKTDFATGLKQPFGMTLVGGLLYVANSDGVVAFPYAPAQPPCQALGPRYSTCPARRSTTTGPRTWWPARTGTKLYATVGSNSNIGENGLENEVGRAAIWEYDVATAKARVFATGIRNPNGLDFEPTTGAMWTVSNERDEIGNDLPPDYLTSVKDGGFYGWPYSYYGPEHVDQRVTPPRTPIMVASGDRRRTTALGPHTASLGLAFYRAGTPVARGSSPKGGAFIGQHGSWNRKPLNGYRVVFVPFAGGRPQMPAATFLTGFLNKDHKIQGRPVGVAVDGKGALLVADDVGGIVWRVAPSAQSAMR